MASVPNGPSPARDQWILQGVEQGRARYAFAPISIDLNGHSATFYVFAQALRIDDVIVTASATVEQQVADLLSCSLLTPQLVDLMWAQRGMTIPPKPRTPGSQMASTSEMLAYGKSVDALVAAQGGAAPDVVVMTEGKDWVLSKKLSAAKAMNYGWHYETSSKPQFAPATPYAGKGVGVLQPAATAHNAQHVDYSQVVHLASRRCVVDGADMDLRDLLQDPTLAPLASFEGVVPVRQPGVDELSAIVGPGDAPLGGSDSGESSEGGMGTVGGLAPWAAMGVTAAVVTGLGWWLLRR